MSKPKVMTVQEYFADQPDPTPEELAAAVAEVFDGKDYHESPADQAFREASHEQMETKRERLRRFNVTSSSWRPRDLSSVWDGTKKRPEATVGALFNGSRAMYPKRWGWAYGPSTAGKTWFALMHAAAEMQRGNPVVYVDLEGDDIDMARLVDMGVDPELLATHFWYVGPREDMGQVFGGKGDEFNGDTALRVILSGDYAPNLPTPTLLIIDAGTEFFALHDLNPDVNTDVATFKRCVESLLSESGVVAAGLVIDHTNKNTAEDERYSTGSGHKVNAATGPCFKLHSIDPLMRDAVGITNVWLAKDRPGAIPAEVITGRDMPAYGAMYVDSTSGGVVVEMGDIKLEASKAEKAEQQKTEQRNDDLVTTHQILTWVLGQNHEGHYPSGNKIYERVGGNRTKVLALIAKLSDPNSRDRKLEVVGSKNGHPKSKGGAGRDGFKVIEGSI